nr:TPA_asm: nucleocapsid protein [Trialeurodes vaporariorum bunya-like virus]
MPAEKQKISAIPFAEMQVSIPESWPEALVRDQSTSVLMPKDDCYKLLFGNKYSEEDITVDAAKPTSNDALASFLCCSFYKTYIKTATGAKVYEISPPNKKTVKIYSLKGVQNADIDQARLLADDAVQCSALYMNRIVSSFYSSEGRFLMTPLARVAMTNERLNSSFTAEKDRVDMVKMLNVCTLRKAHQLIGVTEYADPDLIAASIIRTGYSAQTSKGIKMIAERNLRKITNKGVSLNENNVAKYLAMMTSPSGAPLDIDAVMDYAKSFRGKVTIPSLPKSAEIIRSHSSE